MPSSYSLNIKINRKSSKKNTTAQIDSSVELVAAPEAESVAAPEAESVAEPEAESVAAPEAESVAAPEAESAVELRLEDS